MAQNRRKLASELTTAPNRGSCLWRVIVIGVGVEISGAPLDLNVTRWPIGQNGTGGGWVTSAVFSPRLGKNIGYAMVPIALAEHGTTLNVETADGTRTATVVRKPFVDPKKDLPKS